MWHSSRESDPTSSGIWVSQSSFDQKPTRDHTHRHAYISIKLQQELYSIFIVSTGRGTMIFSILFSVLFFFFKS